MDATIVIYFMKSNFNYNILLSPLIDECKMLLRFMIFSLIMHVFREGNKFANALAHLGSNFQPPPPSYFHSFNALFCICSNPTSSLIRLLLNDA